MIVGPTFKAPKAPARHAGFDRQFATDEGVNSRGITTSPRLVERHELPYLPIESRGGREGEGGVKVQCSLVGFGIDNNHTLEVSCFS